MKISAGVFAAWVLLFAVFRQSHGQDVFSCHPLFSERDAVLLPEVEGSWEISEFSFDTLSFRRAGDNFYTVVLKTRDGVSCYEGAFTRIGSDILLDLRPVVNREIGGPDYRLHLLQMHSCIFVRLDNDTLDLGFLKYRWFYDNIIAQNSMQDYILSDTRLLLTLPTEELRAFLSEHAHDAGFREDDLTFRRVTRPQQNVNEADQWPVENHREMKDTIALDTSQWGCMPSFPYKDGWLGGDGGFSVPLGPLKTLWFFGDTFVGRKDQTMRPGATMVTTIGISTCRPDKTVDIQYYWNDMYTDHPDAFFRSHTDRYRYWQLDAFIYGRSLYVVMAKVGPKPGASPDDIFNFSYVGLTLAKVTDPDAAPPEQWQIELIPWSGVLNALYYNGGLAKDGQYLYIYMLKDRWKNYLVRVPLGRLESPEGYVEYFSRDEV